MKKVLFILIILIGAYYKFKPVEEPISNTSHASTSGFEQQISPNTPLGFTPIYMPQGAKQNEVLILTPIHCTSAEVQAGINLENAIKSQGIPVKRQEGFSINASNITNQERALIDETVSLFKTAKPPLVFINGYAKGSPTISEVVSAFQTTR